MKVTEGLRPLGKIRKGEARAKTSSGVERKGIGKRGRLFLAGLALLGIEAGGGVITELNNDQPMNAQTIVEDAVWPWTLAENLLNLKAPETFNNNAKKTTFGENNVTKTTTDQAIANNLLEPKIKVDEAGTVTVTTLLPGLFPSTIPDTQISSESHTDRESSLYVRKDFIMPEGYQLTFPKGTYYALLQANPETNQNPDLVYTIVTFFYDSENDVSIRLTYESTGFIPKNGQKTIDWDTYVELYKPDSGGKFEDLPLSDGITPIAIPSTSNQVLNMFLYVKSGSIEPISTIEQARAKSRIAVWENSVDPNQKLIVTSSQ